MVETIIFHDVSVVKAFEGLKLGTKHPSLVATSRIYSMSASHVSLRHLSNEFHSLCGMYTVLNERAARTRDIALVLWYDLVEQSSWNENPQSHPPRSE